MGHSSKAGENIFWAMNRNKPGIIKRILNALERFIARIRGKDAYLAVEQRQAAERLRDMLTEELKRAYGTDVKGEAAVENDGEKRYSLAGANSRTADLNSLGGAYQMYQNGVSMDTIRKRTGWWLGKDGKWRYEISDKEMRFNPEGYVDNPQTVGDYVKHDRLFAAYPWVKKINLKFVDEIDGRESLNGKYNRDNDTVYLKNGRTAEQMKSTLIHEIQHAIQVNEEFATGANQKAAAAYLFNITYDKLKNNPKFAGIKSPKDKMHLLKQYVERTTGKTFSEQANYYYYVNYGEQESRAVQKRLAQNEDSDVARIENELFYNGGENYDSAYEIKKSIDNLREMGYTEKQIDRIKKGGIQNDNLSENASQSSLSQESGGRYLHGEDKQSGGYGRTGRMELGVQRGGEIQGSQTGSSGLRVLRVLNEVSKPEKRFSLASSADTVAELQREETELTNRIREIEKSDAFKKANDDLSKAINSDNIAEGMKAYQDWRKESGYADLVDRRDALRADIEKSSESGSGRASAEELAAIEKSGLSEADYFRKQAVNEFGYTPFFYDAGYIVPNGKMLNFSGEKGQHYGSRGEDHRAIGAIYENTKGTDALVRFMNDGNIRIMAETPGLDISASTEPSKEQYTTIRRFANEFSDGGYFAVDLSDENGKTVGTLEYEGNINLTRIVNDIKHFYETGEVREQSGLDRFRYSLARANGITTEITDDSYDEYEGGYQRRDIKLNGETVGTVAIRIYDDYSEIDRIDIDEKYRNKGIGTTVLGDIAGEFDTTYIVPDNESAKRLYERIGEEVTSGEVYENLDQGYGVYRLDKSYGNTRWSLAGTNKDGIEVYETSEKVMNMSEDERKRLSLDMFKNDYRGKTARFYKNGHYYYAQMSPDDARKALYGDRRSSRRGAKALVRTIADGSFFDLIENAEYDRGAIEQGKNTKAHKDVIAWDYFIKTVQIDNRVYDLTADIKKKANGEYVYTLHLTDSNKKAAPAHSRSSGFAKVAETASVDNSVSQNTPDVNSQYMREGEKDSSSERHSLVKSAQSELKALQKENENLRQDVDDLKQELQLTHGRKLSRDALISSIQKILIDWYGVKLSAKELYPHVTNLFDMFYNNTVDGKRLKKDERVDTMRIIEEMDKIVDAVIENAVGVDDTYVEMKKLLPELRNTKLVVPMDARADAAQSAGFENWAEFRKANFGRVGFANEGLPVDTYCFTAIRAMIGSMAWNS